MSEKYRPDIDGLRAIAIVAVVLFHADFPAFGGGFIGVDVFYVISGYLITRIIVDEIDETGSFSFIKFYERRVRRLFPALAVMMAVTSVIAFFVLLPVALENYGKSAVAASLFSANFFFWKTSGYFGPAADRLPLLHTWSLAVEEQFYLLFPPFLIFVDALVEKGRCPGEDLRSSDCGRCSALFRRQSSQFEGCRRVRCDPSRWLFAGGKPRRAWRSAVCQSMKQPTFEKACVLGYRSGFEQSCQK